MPKLISRNPSNGQILKELEMTPKEHLKTLFDEAHQAQIYWGSQPLKHRVRFIVQLRETLLNHVEELSELVHTENGKPHFEAMAHELLPLVETLTFIAKNARKFLKKKRIPLSLMKHRRSDLEYWPLGVVAVISPWNYPLLLPFAQIATALVCGNSVIFKPSEETPLVGLKIQELCEEAGLSPFTLQTVIGDGEIGESLIPLRPAKIFFTGSAVTGKKIMRAAAEFLIPVNLELGGKEAMLVLPDADLDYATSAALWGGFTNSGQVCASVERIFVHEKMAESFQSLLVHKINSLPPSNLGAITASKQKRIYETQLKEAKDKGATILCGGSFSEGNQRLLPTVITGEKIEELSLFQEESFGPLVAISQYQSLSEAIGKVNKSRFGLSASVVTENLSLGKQVARQIATGTVTINETVYTAGLAETPWGGLKESGFGRTHGEIGLHEFVNVRHIHTPRFKHFQFKSLWWFPYSPFQYAAFRSFFELYRFHWFDKMKAIPLFLWNLVQFLKIEKRL